ncbi:MAG: DUF3710 domain-containing protein [Propionibacteriaceae bacterium]|jgi:hypothetical protein|nr:DUF3710 domain-containing protein [Propionibacteriaceae bacterium]
MALFRKGRSDDAIVLPDGQVVDVPEDEEIEIEVEDAEAAEDVADDEDEEDGEFEDEDEGEVDIEVEDGSAEELEEWDGENPVGPIPGELTDDWEPSDDDPRADGPFDIDEVDLSDDYPRVDMGALIITPVEGFGIRTQAQPGTNQVPAVLITWEKSGMELALIAAATSGGTVKHIADELTEEAEEAGGEITAEEGPFGLQLRRLIPVDDGGKKAKFHVSRIWLVEGPRWVIRATILGEAAINDSDPTLLEPFAEFLRNLVVRRGATPMAPGDLIPLTLPEGA